MLRNKLFDKIAYGSDNTNFYIKFYLNEYAINNPSKFAHNSQTYVYMRNSHKKQTTSHP